MEEEIKRRIKILEEKKIPQITAMMLRGGMQERLHRQEILRHGSVVEIQKKKLKKRLSSIKKEKEKFLKDGIGTLPSSSIEPLEDFNEPFFRRIRSKRGFFAYE